jgi:hypothetical protein
MTGVTGNREQGTGNGEQGTVGSVQPARTPARFARRAAKPQISRRPSHSLFRVPCSLFPVPCYFVFLVFLSSCASLLPVGTVLDSMQPEDVDIVVAKVLDRYPQLGRMLVSENFVVTLDQAIVQRPGAEPWNDEDARLVQAIAAHMLGEEIGREWISRVRRERLVVGEGQVFLMVYRSLDAAGKPEYLMDAAGMFELFLPLAAVGEKTSAIEALSFDLKVMNQRVQVPPEGGAVELYGEIIPRNATYSQEGSVYKRWANALFHLGWDQRSSNGSAPAPAGATKRPAARPGGDPKFATFLENTRAYLGPVVRLKIRFDRAADGFHRITLGSRNPIEVVLPTGILTGDRGLENALDRITLASPSGVERRKDDVYVRVGSFFFHPDATSASGAGGPAEAAAREKAADMKRFRLPESK